MSDNGYNDAKLAAEIGVSRPFLTRIKNRERSPSAEVLARLVAKTDLPVEAFLRAA